MVERQCTLCCERVPERFPAKATARRQTTLTGIQRFFLLLRAWARALTCCRRGPERNKSTEPCCCERGPERYCAVHQLQAWA